MQLVVHGSLCVSVHLASAHFSACSCEAVPVLVCLYVRVSPSICMCISFSGDIQDPPGRGPVQPAVGDPASAGGLY